MPTPKERLSHLLELAAQGPEQRAALAGEVADLLLDWPVQYPAAMRATFEALLEKIAREMEFTARGQLAARFAGRSDAPLPLLNEFFLAAPAEMKDAILMRNEAADEVAFATIDADALLAAARTRENFSAALANAAGVADRLPPRSPPTRPDARSPPCAKARTSIARPFRRSLSSRDRAQGPRQFRATVGL